MRDKEAVLEAAEFEIGTDGFSIRTKEGSGSGVVSVDLVPVQKVNRRSRNPYLWLGRRLNTQQN
jgi:hypothetical protein